MKKRYIIAPMMIGAMTFSGYTTTKIKMLENENASLKQEIENKTEQTVEYSTTVEKVKEINKNNINLIIYESDFTDYNLDVEDKSLFGINANIKTKFKMSVIVDLSTADITESENLIIVHVDPNSIKLNEVCVSKPDITYDTNFITNLRGKKIQEIEKDLLMRTYNDIERLVKKEYRLNKDLYKLNMINKLDKLYNSDNVRVVFK